MSLNEVFKVALAVIASFGGTAVILAGLIAWLGKIWSTRILEKERAELAKLQEAYKGELQELSSQRQDALTRRRDVYTQLATTMRVFFAGNDLNSTEQEKEANKKAFLAAYDKAYVWASEAVVAAILEMLDANIKKGGVDLDFARTPWNFALREESTALGKKGGEILQRCMIEMRKDSGFPNADTEYRLIIFGG